MSVAAGKVLTGKRNEFSFENVSLRIFIKCDKNWFINKIYHTVLSSAYLPCNFMQHWQCIHLNIGYTVEKRNAKPSAEKAITDMVY